MITQLKLENFQCHKESVLDFSPGLNVICGSSNTGKSAIIRAIRWVLENRPQGTAIMRAGTRRTVVCLSTQEHEIIHTRTKSTSSYCVDGTEYPKMGRKVPDIVGNLSLPPECFHAQLHPPFLVTASGSAIADVFNDVTNLTKAGMLSKELDRLYKEKRRKAREAVEECKEIGQQLKSKKFRILDRLNKLLKRITSLIAEESHLMSKKNTLCRLLLKAEKAQQFVDRISRYKERLVGGIAEARSKWQQMKQLVCREKTARNLLRRIEELGLCLENIMTKRQQIEDEVRKEIVNLVECPVCGTRLDTQAKARIMERYSGNP